MNKLDVVNAMLGTLGENPLNSLEQPHELKEQGLRMLDLCLTSLLDRGLWFNTEDRTLAVQPDGTILLPADVLSIKQVPRAYPKVSKRGRKLYNNSNSTYLFAGSVKVQVRFSVDFDDLPGLAADYVMAAAVYDFQVAYDADESKSRKLERKKQEAWVHLNAEDIRQTAAIFKDHVIPIQRLRQYGPVFNQ